MQSATAASRGPTDTLGDVEVAASSLTLGDWTLGTATTGSLALESSTLSLLGDWRIGLRDPSLFQIHSSLINLSGGTSSDPNLVGVCGIDFGSDPGGWTNNFAIPNLTITAGSWVRLVDLNENADPGPESLYIDQLVIEPGAFVIAGPNQLHFRTLIGDPLQIIPEPSAVALLGLGATVPVLRRRRRASATGS